MTALTAPRSTVARGGETFSRPVKANTRIYAGALVCLDATGHAVPGAVATTLRSDGRAQAVADNTGGVDGAIRVDVRPGTYRYANSAAGDLIAQADIGADCFVVDDQTVAKTNGGATRSIAGKIVDVDAQGVWVRIGIR